MSVIKTWLTVATLVTIVIICWYMLYPLYRDIDRVMNETLYEDLSPEAKDVYDYNRTFLWNIFVTCLVVFVLLFLYWGWTNSTRKQTVSNYYRSY